jgi:hypothetical protein
MRVAKHADAVWERFGNTRGSNEVDNVPEDQKPGDRYKSLFKGEPNKPGNYQAVVLLTPRNDPERHYPRHRHSFDQVRLTLSGSNEWTPGVPTPPGCIVYTPAGTYYGPYDRHAGEEQLHIQFEGANGAPFFHFDTHAAAKRVLSEKGAFEKGIYSWTDESGKRQSVDAHQAIIEYLTGEDEKFPAPRFPVSINLDPRNFTWLDVAPGVRTKDLATFTEKETRLAMLRLDGQTSYKVSAPDQRLLLFVTEGNGLAGSQEIGERDGVFLEKGDEGVISTTSTLELFVLGLPKLAEASSSGSTRQAELATA